MTASITPISSVGVVDCVLGCPRARASGFATRDHPLERRGLALQNHDVAGLERNDAGRASCARGSPARSSVTTSISFSPASLSVTHRLAVDG